MFYNKQLMGLDLGSYLIKAAQLQKKGKGKYQLKKFGFIPIPVNTMVDGSIMNTYEMNDAVKTLLANLHHSLRQPNPGFPLYLSEPVHKPQHQQEVQSN